MMTVCTDNQLNHDEQGTLFAIAGVLNSTLDLDEVLRLVMDQVIGMLEADRGFLMLENRETSELEFTIARNNRAQALEQREFEQISLSTVKQVVRTQRAHTDADLLDPTHSMLRYRIRSILCVPLLVRGTCIGAAYVDRRSTAFLFEARQHVLFVAFCHQAALAIDNARLFADLAQAMQRINQEKQYQDNILASLANGVITTNASGIITTFNAAAGLILNLDPHTSVGQHYTSVFQQRPQVGLAEMVQQTHTEHEHGTIAPYAVACAIPGRRGPVYLNVSVSSLRDGQGLPIGMVLALDDWTEQKRKETEAREIRDLFQRYVHPHVVKQILDHPHTLRLGGETKEITVVFADIRGYTRLSENLPPEKVMDLLNGYLQLMVEKIWEEEGTLTAFMGDALMAIFNAPLSQNAHALRAVRATWKMREAVVAYHHAHPQETPLSFGFGINSGLAVVGNLGSAKRLQNYTAIGDTVNVAARLQAHAADNNILLHETTYLEVYRYVRVGQAFSLAVKNKTAPLTVRYLHGLLSVSH